MPSCGNSVGGYIPFIGIGDAMQTIQSPEGKKQYDIKCKNCKAVLRCLASELRLVSDQRDGDAYVLDCPHCHQETWIAFDQLPHKSVKS